MNSRASEISKFFTIDAEKRAAVAKLVSEIPQNKKIDTNKRAAGANVVSEIPQNKKIDTNKRVAGANVVSEIHKLQEIDANKRVVGAKVVSEIPQNKKIDTNKRAAVANVVSEIHKLEEIDAEKRAAGANVVSEIHKLQEIDANNQATGNRRRKMAEISINQLIKVTDMYEEAERRFAELSKIKKEREQALTRAPEGKIHIVKADKRIKFYLRKEKADKSGIYIPKSEIDKIRKYVQKSYNEKVVKVLSGELHSLEILLGKLGKTGNIVSSIRNIYSDNPIEVKRMINPVDISDEDYKNEWQKISYTGKVIAENVPFYETKRKERVRSKSELAIANMLDQYDVPYKYECPVTLKNGKTVYPDFTVLNVRKRKTFYWEHRGMMDDRDYARQAVFKAKQFRKNGMLPGDNMIITEETSTDPLGTDEIENVIIKFLI